MDILQEALNSISWEVIIKTGLRVTLVLIIAWVAVKILHKLTGRLERHLLKKSVEEGEPPSESQKRIETIVRLVKQAALLALWLTIVLIILREFGIEIGPIIASAGIVG